MEEREKDYVWKTWSKGKFLDESGRRCHTQQSVRETGITLQESCLICLTDNEYAENKEVYSTRQSLLNTCSYLST